MVDDRSSATGRPAASASNAWPEAASSRGAANSTVAAGIT